MNRLDLFPVTTNIEYDSLTIAGHSLAALAEAHGSPCYVYDRATMDLSVEAYQAAVAGHYSASSRVS